MGWAKHGDASGQVGPHARGGAANLSASPECRPPSETQAVHVGNTARECPFLPCKERGPTRVAHLMEIGRTEQHTERGRRQSTTAPTRHARQMAVRGGV